jgi:uncharacterized protein YutE (UPF0331/DUF86 family)
MSGAVTDMVAVAKADIIERRLARIREEYVGHEAELETDITRQDAILVNLQRACEAAIGLANRIVRRRRLGVPQRSADAFESLARAGLLDRGLAARMKAMVGFRNIAVHDYRALDLAKVREIIERRLDDLSAFGRAMLALPEG